MYEVLFMGCITYFVGHSTSCLCAVHAPHFQSFMFGLHLWKNVSMYTHTASLKHIYKTDKLWKKYLTWRCWTSLLLSFAGGFPRGGWSGGGPLKQFVLHVGSLDVNTRLPKQHDAVQHFQRNQPEEGEGCSLERCISEWKKCSVTLNQKLFPLLQN